ncbi:MAG: hypothetical protein ACKVQU_03130 [Burkholderiales bacterium]
MSLLPLRIFVASPGDVPSERAQAREVVEGLRYDPGLKDRITTEVVAWDNPATETPMLATLHPQAAIERGLPKPSDCDIVLSP